jgi:hypothetical protein
VAARTAGGGSSTARTVATVATISPRGGLRMAVGRVRDPRVEPIRDGCSSWAAPMAFPHGLGNITAAPAVTATPMAVQDIVAMGPAGVSGVGGPGPTVPPLPLPPSAAAAAAIAAGVAQRLDSSGSVMTSAGTGA